MRPIEEFSYGKEIANKMLLLKMRSPYRSTFTLGYYEAESDTFRVCFGAFRSRIDTFKSAKDYIHAKMPVFAVNGPHCIMPGEFLGNVGAGKISHFMLMEEALKHMEEKDMFDINIDKVLENAPYFTSYLIYTNDNCITIGDVGCQWESGKQFQAYTCKKADHGLYQVQDVFPREEIKYVVDLSKLECPPFEDKGITGFADALFEEFKKYDFSFLQQEAVMARIRDIMKRQVTEFKKGKGVQDEADSGISI